MKEHEVKFYIQREEADTTDYVVMTDQTTSTGPVSSRDLVRGRVTQDDLDRERAIQLRAGSRSRSRSPRNRD